RRLAGAHLMAETRADEAVLEDQPGVGGEHQVGQTRLGLHQLDLRTEPAQGLVQGAPLPAGTLAVGVLLHAHPRVDLVLDAVVIGRTHENACATHESLTPGVWGERSFLSSLSP